MNEGRKKDENKKNGRSERHKERQETDRKEEKRKEKFRYYIKTQERGENKTACTGRERQKKERMVQRGPLKKQYLNKEILMQAWFSLMGEPK